MVSFKTAREALVIGYDNDIIDDEEFVLLYDAFNSNNLPFPYYNYPIFSLEDKDESECIADFRVKKNDLPLLSEALGIPPVFKCKQGTVCDGMEGLCIFLNRFSYPCRYSDMIPMFGRPVPEICMICNEVVDCIYENHSHRIMEWNPTILNPQAIAAYATAIKNKGAALDNCFGFVDGTVRPICKPKKNQRVVYNGHKRVHAIKFQSVVIPNGLIANLYGPVEGKRHDSSMLAESQLCEQLELFAFSPDARPLCLYGDPAYPMRLHLQAPFHGHHLDPMMRAYNKSMSKVRTSVEWIFGDIVNYFKFMDFKKNLKIGLSQIGKMYVVCAILQNALTCLYGNTTSQFFNLDPPDLNEYFV